MLIQSSTHVCSTRPNLPLQNKKQKSSSSTPLQHKLDVGKLLYHHAASSSACRSPKPGLVRRICARYGTAYGDVGSTGQERSADCQRRVIYLGPVPPSQRGVRVFVRAVGRSSRQEARPSFFSAAQGPGSLIFSPSRSPVGSKPSSSHLQTSVNCPQRRPTCAFSSIARLGKFRWCSAPGSSRWFSRRSTLRTETAPKHRAN